MQNGITLIALIITIIVMLILVSVTVRTVLNSGLFENAGEAVKGYDMEQAREILGTTLASAQMEKYTNPIYNQSGYLNSYIESKINGASIVGNVVKVRGWCFAIDRNDLSIKECLGREETLENETLNRNILSIGDYVAYSPDGNNSTNLDGTVSGTGSDQTIDREDLTWQIMDINSSTGVVTLISTVPTTGTVTLKGANGYNNGVKALNDICKTLYSKSGYGTGRSLNILDIETKMNSTGINARNAYNVSANVQYNTTKTYSGDHSNAPDFYKDVGDSEVIAQESNDYYTSYVTSTGYSKLNTLTARQTYYSNPGSTGFDNQTFYNQMFSTNKSYWLASRCVTCSDNLAFFALRYVTSSTLGRNLLFYSDGTSIHCASPVRPVVIIDSDVKFSVEGGITVDLPKTLSK